MSSIRDIIAKLKAAGVVDAVILSVVEDIDGMIASVKPGPSKGAERTRRWREKQQASQNVTSDVTCDVSGDATPSPPDGPPSPPAPPLPPLNPPTPSVSRRERGCALPASWQPNAKHFDLGLQLGRDRRWVEGQAAEFRDWAAANSNRPVGRKADWDAAFRNWLRTSAAKGQRGPPQGRRTFSDIVDESLAEIAGQENGNGHREADHHSGPTLDLVAGGRGSDHRDIQPVDAGWWGPARDQR